jgi:hypothetical protein
MRTCVQLWGSAACDDPVNAMPHAASINAAFASELLQRMFIVDSRIEDFSLWPVINR